MTSRRLLVPALLSSLVACISSAEPAARAQAAEDTRCPEEEITMTKLDDGDYQAQGCATYGVYHCTSLQVTRHAPLTWDCERQGK